MTSVTFKKTVSDGNYGSEVAEVTLEVDVEILEDGALSDIDKAIEDGISASLATVRRLVHAELAQSPSANVRRALEYPHVTAAGPMPNGVDTVPDPEDLPF
ncbi:MAG TPA: hypothetical protein VFB50_01545 [Chloroflexota bacterium]|nr:hypothetical protein [Chloroflexota bacterium]